MTLRRRSMVALALVAVLGAGCSDGGDSAPPRPAADTVVLMKPGSTDLNALDLRDKLIDLPGVESVVYDQPDMRLRVDFTTDATGAQRQAVADTAKSDPAVERVDDTGGAPDTRAPQQAPAPGVESATTSPSS